MFVMTGYVEIHRKKYKAFSFLYISVGNGKYKNFYGLSPLHADI